MPQLDTATFLSQLFWLGVFFITLYLILSYIAVPKITFVINNREDILKEKINKASVYREQAEEFLTDYELSLKEARKIAQEKYKDMVNISMTERAERQSIFLDKFHEKLRLAEQKLYRMRIKANAEIELMKGDVAALILQKLIDHPYSSEDLLERGEEV